MSGAEVSGEGAWPPCCFQRDWDHVETRDFFSLLCLSLFLLSELKEKGSIIIIVQEGVSLQPAPPMGRGPALHGMSQCSPGLGFPAAEEAPQELGCALTQPRQPVQQQHFYRNKENFIPLLPPWITSLFPEHPGADNWPKIRAAGAGVRG